jgi:TetR/AcrR family transcriptional regulator, fatty acid metabolism regulator protein
MQPTQPAANTKKDRTAIIFEAACAVIREKGFHQARIRDIAAAAKISYGLVYHYFKSKADLFDAILGEWWTGLFAMMDRSNMPSQSVEQKLGDIVKYFLDQYEQRPDLVHIFITEISRSAANLTPPRLDRFKMFMNRTEEIITEAQGAKNLRGDVKARYLTYIFLGALECFVSTMVLENQPLKGQGQKDRIERGIMEVFLNGARSEVGQ